MKDRPILRCSFLRACELALLTLLRDKSCCVAMPPGHRHPLRRTPGVRCPPSPSIPTARFIEHNSVLSPKKAASTVTLTAELTLALGQGSARASRAGILHANRLPLR